MLICTSTCLRHLPPAQQSSGRQVKDDSAHKDAAEDEMLPLVLLVGDLGHGWRHVS